MWGRADQARVVRAITARTAVAAFAKIDDRRRVIARQVERIVAVGVPDGEDRGHLAGVEAHRFIRDVGRRVEPVGRVAARVVMSAPYFCCTT